MGVIKVNSHMVIGLSLLVLVRECLMKRRMLRDPVSRPDLLLPFMERRAFVCRSA